MSTELDVQMGIDINNLMSTRDRLQKELNESKALVASLKHREDLLRKQFAFYIQYGQKADAGELPTL